MKLLITIALSIICLAATAQHIAITGGVYNADSMRITVYHGGKIVSEQEVYSRVYTIFLGDYEYYEIKFESNARTKTLHFFCYNIKDPITIEQSVHFNNQTNLIIWYWRSAPASNKLKIEKTIWGAHASWKDEF